MGFCVWWHTPGQNHPNQPWRVRWADMGFCVWCNTPGWNHPWRGRRLRREAAVPPDAVRPLFFSLPFEPTPPGHAKEDDVALIRLKELKRMLERAPNRPGRTGRKTSTQPQSPGVPSRGFRSGLPLGRGSPSVEGRKQPREPATAPSVRRSRPPPSSLVRQTNETPSSNPACRRNPHQHPQHPG